MRRKNNRDNKAKKTLLTAAQSVYLTCVFFIKNNLFMYASSCAFGFLFSAVPVFILIIAFVIRFWHTAPEAIMQLYDFRELFVDTDQLHELIETLLTVRRFGIFEILIMFSVFWMSQRFFFSVMNSIRNIFHNKTRRRPLLENIFLFAGEAALVIGIGTVIFLVITIKPLLTDAATVQLKLPIIPGFMPLIVKCGPYILLFVIIACVFHFAPGTKPGKKLCVCAAACTSGIFLLVQKFFSIFLNISRYNLIYGVLGKLIVIMLEVCTFFYLFLFFAQYVYVSQFFDSLLLAELYLLPGKNETDILSVIRRTLFIRPERFIRQRCHRDCRLVSLKKGETLYSCGDDCSGIYYLVRGTMELERNGDVSVSTSGTLFGEAECLLHTVREETARAATPAQLLWIPDEVFHRLMLANPEVAQKAMTQVPEYFSRIYGRN